MELDLFRLFIRRRFAATSGCIFILACLPFFVNPKKAKWTPDKAEKLCSEAKNDLQSRGVWGIIGMSFKGKGGVLFVFNIGASELIVILLIAFLVVGPKDLPKVGRALGRAVRQAKRMVEELKRESGLEEMQNDLKEIETETRNAAKSVDIRPELQKAQLEMNKEIRDVKKELSFKDFKSMHGGGKT